MKPHLFQDHQPATRPIETRLRFDPVTELSSGKASFHLTRIDPLYEELNVFGMTSPAIAATPSAWLGAAIELLTREADAEACETRPLHVPAPVSILLDPNAALAADSTVRRTTFCPQEICIELSDAAFGIAGEEALPALLKLRRKGFRIALDARTSWTTPLNHDLRPHIERIRVPLDEILADDIYVPRLAIAEALGIDLIADRAKWRQVDELQELGINYALSLVADG